MSGSAPTIDGLTYIGVRQLTAYEESGNCCADGAYPVRGHTIASNDPMLWHRWVYIEGYGTYYCHDRGGMSIEVIDIYLGSVSDCIAFGRRSANCYLVN